VSGPHATRPSLSEIPRAEGSFRTDRRRDRDVSRDGDRERFGFESRAEMG
jgi:hypothetical protein